MDARDTPFWTGAQLNQQRAARAGRVPGARNVPFNRLVEESGRLLGVEELRALFAQAGVAPGRPVVVYCHVGQQASLLLVAARLLGHEVRLYDGSYEDWSKRPELRVETGP
jgi:thiosulfate/3-mercaptopyruvate sulfurtransferase